MSNMSCPLVAPERTKDTDTIYFALGWFWGEYRFISCLVLFFFPCLYVMVIFILFPVLHSPIVLSLHTHTIQLHLLGPDASFSKVNGVVDVMAGYTGGQRSNPTYRGYVWLFLMVLVIVQSLCLALFIQPKLSWVCMPLYGGAYFVWFVSSLVLPLFIHSLHYSLHIAIAILLANHTTTIVWKTTPSRFVWCFVRRRCRWRSCWQSFGRNTIHPVALILCSTGM